jgi:hypothetical protein
VDQVNNGVSVLMNNGDGTFAARVDYAMGDTPVTMAVGDLNADGRPDLAVAGQKTLSILYNRCTP